MEATTTQQALFKQVKERMPAHLSLPEEIAELLGVSADSAYRRIRGEKLMDLGELAVVCGKYNLSIDALLAPSGKSFVFTGRFLGSGDYSFTDWLRGMNEQLEQLADLPDPLFIFRAEDIPSFHHFQVPELALFKFFFWRRTILQDPAFRSRRFSLADKEDEMLALARKVSLTYNRLPSTEIWNADSLNAFLRQIAFYRDAGIFARPEEAQVIFDKLLELIDHLQHETEAGVKFLIGEPASSGSTKLTVYVNEIMMGDNMIHVASGGQRMVFLNHSALNYVSTTDAIFCDHTFNSINNVISKSILISATGEKERNRYFNLLRGEVEMRRK